MARRQHPPPTVISQHRNFSFSFVEGPFLIFLFSSQKSQCHDEVSKPLLSSSSTVRFRGNRFVQLYTKGKGEQNGEIDDEAIDGIFFLFHFNWH